MAQRANFGGNILTESRQSEIKSAVNIAMDEKFNGWKQTITFWALVFLLVLVLLVTIGVLCIADLAKTLSDLTDIANDGQASAITIERNSLLSADYLAAVIPILLALGGSFIAFLGMNRLKMFDERIDQTRSEMLVEIEAKVKSELAVTQVTFIEQIKKEIEGEREKFTNTAKGAGEQLADQTNRYIEELQSQYNVLKEGYGWLEAIQGSLVAANEYLDFYTVAAAHRILEQLFQKKPAGYIQLVKKIVDRVCGLEGISGDSADYHNIAAELARNDEYAEACKILKHRIDTCKDDEDDVDLLSDMVLYATKISHYTEAKKAVETLESLDRRRWTWRCYEFICDYYRAIGALEEADKLCDEFISAIPNDEHGYRSKAEITKLLYPGMDGIEKSIKVLQCAIDANVNCPQCANALAEIYLSIGKYKEALSAANRAVLELAQDQPHVNIAYVFYNRATIRDRMFMQGLENSEINQVLVDEAYEDYHMSLSFGGLSYIVLQQANIRIKILRRYITPGLIQKGENEESEMLLSLLSKVASEN